MHERWSWLLLLAMQVVVSHVAAQDRPGRSGSSDTESGWVRRFGRFRMPDEHERNHLTVRAAFRDVVLPTSRCTVRVLCDGGQVALGTIVREDGYILSKASELAGDAECQLSDGRRMRATLIAMDEATDLALLKIPAFDLPAAQWSQEPAPPVGSWLATASLEETPAAIGVVSAPNRAIPKPRAVLGVVLENSQQGPRIGRIVPGSPASRAGLQSGDIVVRMNGQELANRDTLMQAIASRQPGDQVVLSIVRAEQSLSVTATLEEVSRLGNEQQAELMENLGGPLSKRRHGFPAVMQHDSVLRPRDCGGPLVDLDGKVVGLNIARASRVASYALPSGEVRAVLEHLIAKELTPVASNDRPGEPAVVAGP